MITYNAETGQVAFDVALVVRPIVYGLLGGVSAGVGLFIVTVGLQRIFGMYDDSRFDGLASFGSVEVDSDGDPVDRQYIAEAKERAKGRPQMVFFHGASSREEYYEKLYSGAE